MKAAEKAAWREANRILGELHIDLSDYSYEFVLGFVQGVKAEREFDPSLWGRPGADVETEGRGMTLRVTVEDIETGDTESRLVSEGDYILTVATPCYLHHIQAFANGTHVLTLKGLTPAAERRKRDEVPE